MDSPTGLRHNSNALNLELDDGDKGLDHESFQVEAARHNNPSDYHVHSMGALEILRETVRILRYNSSGFMAIAAVLICPVSAVFLTKNVLVDQSLVKWLTMKLSLVAKSSGFPLNPFVKQSCLKLSETVVSFAMCFPLFVTLLLLSKACVVHSVDCTYSRKKFDSSKCYVLILKIWKRVLFTYLWACLTISGCITVFLVILLVSSSIISIMGFLPELIIYPAMAAGLVFSIIIGNAIVICNTAVVISVLEDVTGPQALLRSSSLISGQTQVGLLIFLGSTIGMAVIETLFDHRVKTISYGDGSSRIWEGPLLVLMYSFVVLIDFMMGAVFYFSCKSYHLESANQEMEHEGLLET